MALDGGALIISMSGYDFTLGEAKVVKNISKKLASTQKHVILCGVKIGGVLYRDTVVQLVKTGSVWIGNFNIVLDDAITVTKITVSADDEVTFSNSIIGG